MELDARRIKWAGHVVILWALLNSLVALWLEPFSRLVMDRLGYIAWYHEARLLQWVEGNISLSIVLEDLHGISTLCCLAAGIVVTIVALSRRRLHTIAEGSVALLLTGCYVLLVDPTTVALAYNLLPHAQGAVIVAGLCYAAVVVAELFWAPSLLGRLSTVVAVVSAALCAVWFVFWRPGASTMYQLQMSVMAVIFIVSAIVAVAAYSGAARRRGPGPAPGRPVTSIGKLLAVAAVIGVVAWMLLMVMGMRIIFSVLESGLADDVTPRTRCLQNIKQLALGQMMYAEDYDGYLPVAGDWPQALGPYYGNETDTLFCPADSRSEKQRSGKSQTSYTMSSEMSGVNISQLATPEGIGLLFDGTQLFGGHEDAAFRHNERLSVACADGTGQSLSRQSFDRLRLAP